MRSYCDVLRARGLNIARAVKYRLSFNFERNEVRILENIRKTVYNNITSEEKLAKVNPENIQLGDDFLEYLTSIDRAKTTVIK